MLDDERGTHGRRQVGDDRTIDGGRSLDAAAAPLERGDQLLDPDGLRDVIVHPGGRAQLAVALHRVRRHRHDARALAAPAPVDLAGGLEPSSSGICTSISTTS